MKSADQPILGLSHFRRLIPISCAILLLSACTWKQIPVTTIHQDGRIDVFLETVSDSSFQAAHPIKLDEAAVANVLRGVHTKEKSSMMLLIGKALLSTNLSETRTFYDDDIALLAPPITAALSQAAPNQRVGFRLYHTDFSAQAGTDANKRETTAGYLAADSLSLHVTLTQYRYKPGKAESIQKMPRPLPDPDGLRDRDVTFVPEAALRPESRSDASWFGGSGNRTFAVDYHLLAKLLAAPPRPGHVAPTAGIPGTQPAQQILVPVAPSAANDAEMQAFKEELKAMQKRLAEQDAELQELKKSSPTKK
ncbi:MAG TPA: hypothetical protein VFX56_12740 [Nitrospira sp.]|nr:hypothetical protein [Nitrospira sp.]